MGLKEFVPASEAVGAYPEFHKLFDPVTELFDEVDELLFQGDIEEYGGGGPLPDRATDARDGGARKTGSKTTVAVGVMVGVVKGVNAGDDDTVFTEFTVAVGVIFGVHCGETVGTLELEVHVAEDEVVRGDVVAVGLCIVTF